MRRLYDIYGYSLKRINKPNSIKSYNTIKLAIVKKSLKIDPLK